MQKDYMAMAQGQAAPQEQLTEQDVNELIPTDEEFSQDGFTPGDSPEKVKQRILEFLEKLGLMEDFKDQYSKLEFTKKLDEYVKALFAGDEEAVASNPIHAILTEASASMGDISGDEMPQQAPAANKDFASMMPPGGGMSG
jgi:hypothetical protein